MERFKFEVHKAYTHILDTKTGESLFRSYFPLLFVLVDEDESFRGADVAVRQHYYGKMCEIMNDYSEVL